jgi:diphthine-ammonia ligase
VERKNDKNKKINGEKTMRIGALISGGKDSLAAAYKASKEHNLVCLIAIKSKNPESYMFHIPNIDLVKLQAEAMQLPLVFLETEGIKEEELNDLKDAIQIAKEKYRIQGLVSGAIASKYQKERIEKICYDLKLQSITPLWHINNFIYQRELLRDFHIVITGIAAEGLDESDLGKRFNISFLDKIKKLNIHRFLEGGEGETFVLNCPLFKKRLVIEEAEKHMESEICGQYIIKKIKLINNFNIFILT